MRSRILLFTAFFALGAIQYALVPNVVELFRSSTSLDALAVDESQDEQSASREPRESSPKRAARSFSSESAETIILENAFEPNGLFFQGLFGAPGFRANESGPIDADHFPLAVTHDRATPPEGSPTYSHWARFPAGSWARRRTTTISYENNRPVQSVTETRILLKSVDVSAGRYELEYESVVKLGSFDYQRRSETLAYDFWDAPADGVVTSQALEPVNLTIGAKTIPCLTRRIVRENGATRDATTFWYSNVVSPYILQKETIRESLSERSSRVSRVGRELFVVQKIAARSALGGADAEYLARSSAVVGNRRQTTAAVYSAEAPGGLLRETTIETLANERRPVLQTSTVLLDYYVAK